MLGQTEREQAAQIAAGNRGFDRQSTTFILGNRLFIFCWILFSESDFFKCFIWIFFIRNCSWQESNFAVINCPRWLTLNRFEDSKLGPPHFTQGERPCDSCAVWAVSVTWSAELCWERREQAGGGQARQAVQILRFYNCNCASTFKSKLTNIDHPRHLTFYGRMQVQVQSIQV